MQTATYIWAKVIGLLEERLGAVAVSAMLDDAELVEMNEKALVIYSPSDFRQETIRRSYKAHIEEILHTDFQLDIAFEVWGDSQLHKHRQADKDAPLWTYNPHFSFDSFVAGASNQVPLKAAMHVAAHMGDSVYNPLYLYGPPGVGKTHLLYSIANEASQRYPDAKIVYIKGDQFTNELIQAIMQHTTSDFKKKYRNADILLVDDIQFIAGKESTQEEFFHTFNTLYEHQKQIVMTSDRPPKEMATLEERLKGRFGAGFMEKIEPPDLQTRKRILQAKAQALGLPLNEEITDFLAHKLCDNVRQIEGGLRKIRAFKDLSDMRLTLENISRTVSDIQTSETSAVVTPDLVIRYVCRYYGVEPQQLTGVQRSKNISEPRQVAMYLLRQMTKMNQSDIGKYFGRDHSTVKYALSAVEKALASGNGMESQLQDIMRNIEANV